MAKTTKKATKASSSKVKEVAQELNEQIKKIVANNRPKQHVLTDEDLDKLRRVEEAFTTVRKALQRMRGEMNISEVMFEAGSAFTVINEYEDILSDVLNKFLGCDDCGDYDY